MYAERVLFRGLSAVAQAESLKFKLLAGLAVRRACYGVIRYVMENEAKGVEVIVSGKLRSQRAKAMKFCDGYVIFFFLFLWVSRLFTLFKIHEEVRSRHHRIRR